MGLSFGEVRTWDVGSFERAERGHLDRVGELSRLEDSLRAAGVWEVSESQGSAAVTARLSLQADLVTDQAAVSQFAANVCRRLGNGATALRDRALDLTSQASGAFFTITDAGTVIDTLPCEDDPLQREQRLRLKRDFEQHVDVVVKQADALVAAAAADLSAAARGEVSDGGAVSVGQAVDSQRGIDIPSRGDDPIAVAAWWKSLSPGEQNRLLRDDPGALGNLDGIPNEVRDAANMKVLPTQLEEWRRRRADLEERIRALPTVPELNRGLPTARSRERERLTAELEEAEGKVADLEAVQRSVSDDYGNRIPGRRLLLLDAHAGPNVEAAVAFGDVDKADNVALTVPGYTSTARGSIVRMADEAEALVDQAEKLNSGTSTAAIAFMGYQAPQDIPGTSTNPAAHAGAPKVATALEGLSVTTQVSDQNLTAVGHSYGSNVTGVALQQLASNGEELSPVDSVVLYGSPGVDNVGETGVVPRTSDMPGWMGYREDVDLGQMGIQEGRGYYMSAPADFVSEPWSPIPGNLGPTPDEWGMEELKTEASHTELGPRDGPSRAGFSPDDRILGIIPYENHQHSDYPDAGRTSGYNIAAVAAGTPEKTIR